MKEKGKKMQTKIIIFNDNLLQHRKEFESYKEELNEMLAKFEEMETTPANRSYVRMMAAKINVTLQNIESNLHKVAFAYDMAERYAERILNSPCMNNTIVVDEAKERAPKPNKANDDEV